jgi:hypothetical protein
MFDSVVVKTKDEETAVAVAESLYERFRPQLLHEGDGWQVWIESADEDELPDLLGALHERLRAPEPSIQVLINGGEYRPPTQA